MEQDQQKQALEESSRPEAIGVTRAMHQSKVRGRKRERNKHGFLAALLGFLGALGFLFCLFVAVHAEADGA